MGTRKIYLNKKKERKNKIIMNETEYIKTLSQIPKNIKKKHSLLEPFDRSPYQCIHSNKYDYYPELNCCMINETPVIWEENEISMTPENPEHLKEMQHRVNNKLKPGIYVIYKDTNDILNCKKYNLHERTFNYMRKRNFTASITVDNKTIYYNPENTDLPNHPNTIKLATCIFYAMEHNTIGILPEKDAPIEEWQAIAFKGDDNNS